jgi:hypothetical protein
MPETSVRWRMAEGFGGRMVAQRSFGSSNGGETTSAHQEIQPPNVIRG